MAIQQKLHTKLVQKLILTPSLQQAIKLLPMSTLELSDLLNQEMVENPMLEEVPTEELQPAEANPAAEKPDTATGRSIRSSAALKPSRVSWLAPLDPKYLRAPSSAAVNSPICSRWTWTSIAVNWSASKPGAAFIGAVTAW